MVMTIYRPGKRGLPAPWMDNAMTSGRRLTIEAMIQL
jgi:hypothetical protein